MSDTAEMASDHNANLPTTVAPQVLLINHFKALKLPTFAREYEKVGIDCAREGIDYPRYLLRYSVGQQLVSGLCETS